MVPCAYCVGDKASSINYENYFCQWCNDTKDDAVRIEREKFFFEHEEMVSDHSYKSAALDWWFDYNDEQERLEMLKQGIRFEQAYEDYLSEMADTR